MYKNILHNIFSTFITLCTPIITIPILTSKMGLESYGEYIVLIELGLIFFLLFDFGFGMYFPKELAKSSSELKKRYLVTNFIICKSIIILMIILGYITFNYQEISLPFLIYLIVLNINISPLLVGLNQYKKVNQSVLISRLLLILLIIVIDFEKDFFTVMEIGLLIQSFILLLQFSFLTRVIYRYINLKAVSFKYLIRLVNKSFAFYASRLFMNIFQQGSSYIVSLFLSKEAVAIYSIVIQFYKAGIAIIGSVSQVLYTTMSHSLQIKMLLKVMLITIITMIIGWFVYIFIGEDIFNILNFPNTNQLFILFKPLYLSLFFVALSSYLGYPIMVAIGKENHAHLGVIIPPLIYFLVVILIQELTIIPINEFSFIFALVVTDLFSMLLRLFFIYKNRKLIF